MLDTTFGARLAEVGALPGSDPEPAGPASSEETTPRAGPAAGALGWPVLPRPQALGLLALLGGCAASAGPVAPDALPTRNLGTATRSLDQSVHSLALGKPRVGALVRQGDALVPWWLDQGAWTALPLPEPLGVSAADLESARYYFGRNDKPRVMGTRTVEGRPQQLYLRLKGSSWVHDKEEIEELARPPLAPLFGLLGHEDPEVVCRLADRCIIKRLTGWTRIDAPPGTPRVDLSGPRAYAWSADTVWLLDGTRWTVVSDGAELTDVRGVWGDDAELWLSDRADPPVLWHRTGEGWTKQPAPMAEPGALWGTGPQDLFLAGADGLAHYDGATWALVDGVVGPLDEVLGRTGEVWAAGASGVWHLPREPRR